MLSSQTSQTGPFSKAPLISPTAKKIAVIRAMLFENATALFLLAAMAYLYYFLFVPPFVPVEGNGIGDCYLYLAPGQRMFDQGQLIYRDVFEFVTPGTALVNLLMLKLFGLRVWIPNVLVMLLTLGLVWTGVVISRKLMRPSLVFLPSTLFLLGARPYLYDPTHHWYSLLAAMAAIAVMLERRTTARIVAAGFFCGLCASFTQTRGLTVYVGFAVFLLWESWQTQEKWRPLLKRQAWLLTGFVATCLAVNGYFIWKAGIARFFWCTVVFVLKYYPQQADANTFRTVGTDFPNYESLHTFLRPFLNWLSLVALPPVVYILFFARYWRERDRKSLEYWQRPMLVGIVGFFMFLSIAPSPGIIRMTVSSLPALVLLGWLLDSPRKAARTFLVIFSAWAVFVAVHSLTRRKPVSVGTLTTPQGKLVFTNETLYQEYIWMQDHTRPGDYFFGDGEDFPTEHFYLNLRYPTPLTGVTPNGYTTSEQVAEVVAGLKQHPTQYIYWETKGMDDIPKWENPADDHLGPLRDYMRSNYRVVKVFAGTDEIWERNAN